MKLFSLSRIALLSICAIGCAVNAQTAPTPSIIKAVYAGEASNSSNNKPSSNDASKMGVSLDLALPSGWVRTIEKDGTTSRIYKVTNPSLKVDDKKKVEVLISVFDLTKAPKRPSAQDLEPFVINVMARNLYQSVEKNVNTLPFGPNNDGVYATLTDKKPSAGEYKYMTQGARLLKDKYLVFTILSQESGDSIATGLATLSSAQ